MITIISATNRPQSECLKLSRLAFNLVKSKTSEDVQLLDMSSIPYDWIHPDMYNKNKVSESLNKIIDQYLTPASKWLIISPEYNGSYPGILKLFLDACSVTPLKKNIFPKKAALIGVASGRAGNLRGMDHLTGVLNYLGFILYPDKLPISSIKTLQDTEGNISNPDAITALEKFLDNAIKF